jgi:uncharacterized membrane protein
MDNSLFIAQLLGPIMFILGVGILLNFKHYLKMIDDYTKNTSLLFFGGILNLIIGLLLVLTHNHWAWEWYAIITLFGWAALIKGLTLIIFPDWMVDYVKKIKKNTSHMQSWSWVIVILGGYLSYIAFWA